LHNQWKPILLSIVIILGGVLGYSYLNGRINNVHSLTWTSNVNLFGKVMEYRMAGLSTDDKYRVVQEKAILWTNEGKYDPWNFAAAYTLNYAEEHFNVEGAFAWSVIERHPLDYLGNSIPDVLNVWLSPAYFYPLYGPVSAAQTPASSSGSVAMP